MRGDIMRLVIEGAALMTLAGLATGVALALLTMRLLASLLYQVQTSDPLTFGVVAAVLVAAAAVAAYLPARRAVRTDATLVLRPTE
jgi:putative ABC transport system permease protein